MLRKIASAEATEEKEVKSISMLVRSVVKVEDSFCVYITLSTVELCNLQVSQKERSSWVPRGEASVEQAVGF